MAVSSSASSLRLRFFFSSLRAFFSSFFALFRAFFSALSRLWRAFLASFLDNCFFSSAMLVVISCVGESASKNDWIAMR